MPFHFSRHAPRLLLLGLALAACARSHPVATTPAFASGPPDTIALTRTRCLGRCPAYELVMTRGGRVRVRGDADVAARAVAKVPDSTMDALGRQALAGGFYALPARTEGDASLCPIRATDHPSLTVRIAQGNERTEVSHYTGCYVSASPLRKAPALVALEVLADSIDAAAGTGRPR